jgi:precorrin-6A/cobalt-precorrin-6A reductase
MILLFGGTSEAKQVATLLEEVNQDYIYSTKTAVNFQGEGQYRCGPLDQQALEEFCRVHQISCIINASHPFASELHQTVATAGLNIPLIRFERQFPERINHPLVHYIKDYTQALELVATKGYTSMLALSGVQSIPKLKTFWQKHPCWFRILDRDYSRDFAARHQFPPAQLLFGLPQDEEAEIKLFTQLRPDAILSKESGLNGKLDAKIGAAIACHIPLMIIEKPALSPAYRLVHTREELLSLIPRL